MKSNGKSAVFEAYVILENANETYLDLNQGLAHFGYKVCKLGLDELERDFREYFGLERFATNHFQSKVISGQSKDGYSSICISEEFYHAINATFSNKNAFLQVGYAMVLKKTFVIYEGSSLNLVVYEAALRKVVSDFSASLSKSMCLAGYKGFRARHLFLYLPHLQKIVNKKEELDVIPHQAPLDYLVKDNYFIKVFLLFESKQKDHLKKAVSLFFKALNLVDHKDQFLQLFQALETCFFNLQSQPLSPDHLAKYVFVLTDENTVNYENLCDDFTTMFEARARLINLNISSIPEYDLWLPWLEKTTGLIIKKMLRFNHYSPLRFSEMLHRKFLLLNKKTAWLK